MRLFISDNTHNDSLLTSPVDDDHEYDFDHDPEVIEKMHFQGEVFERDHETTEECLIESENEDHLGNFPYLSVST